MTWNESVDGCMLHWEFMAETGTNNKRDYEPVQNYPIYCFFCVFLGHSEQKTCNPTCPGHSYWAMYKKEGEGHCMDCLETGDTQTSLFKHWELAETPEERKLWAHRIVWMIWLIKEDGKKGDA